MNVMVVAVFDSETAAFEGLRALRDLHKEGGISLYASALIVKDKAGKVSVKKEVDDGPVGTGLGFLTGGLLGSLGGPAGTVIGVSLGSLTGALHDLEKAGIGVAFLSDVAKALTPGKAAVLAEVEESWPTSLLDSRLREQGGTLFRQFRADVVEDQLVREGAVFAANIKALDDELNRSAAEDQAAIQKDIDEAKKQLRETQVKAKARLDQAKSETEAKVQLLHDQAKGARDRAKARIEKRIADAKADFEVRSKKLNQAWKLTKEAFTA